MGRHNDRNRGDLFLEYALGVTKGRIRLLAAARRQASGIKFPISN